MRFTNVSASLGHPVSNRKMTDILFNLKLFNPEKIKMKQLVDVDAVNRRNASATPTVCRYRTLFFFRERSICSGPQVGVDTSLSISLIIILGECNRKARTMFNPCIRNDTYLQTSVQRFSHYVVSTL